MSTSLTRESFNGLLSDAIIKATVVVTAVALIEAIILVSLESGF